MAATALPAAAMQRLLEDLAQRNGFKRPRYAVSMGSQKGDNYLGVIYRVVVSEEGADEPGLQLIFKGMPASAKRREVMCIDSFFGNEFLVYQEVLPAFTRFLAEKGVDEVRYPEVLPYAPRCYDALTAAAEGDSTLVLEDMRPLGFTMHDRRVGLCEQHVGAVFRALAFLHASSLAMEAQRPEQFAKLRESVKETMYDPNSSLLEHVDDILPRTYGFIKDRFPEDSVGYQKLKAFIDNFKDNMAALVTPSATNPNAISHGDCWTNNLLFKYGKSGDVERVCLLDFQLTRYAPPVLDLVYLAYSCTVREWRLKHLDRMFREYHDALSGTLRRLGCDPEQVYSWETMQTQLRERGVFGLGVAIMAIPAFLVDSAEVPDMDAAFDNGTSMNEIFDTSHSKSAPERNKRVSDVLQEMVDRGWL